MCLGQPEGDSETTVVLGEGREERLASPAFLPSLGSEPPYRRNSALFFTSLCFRQSAGQGSLPISGKFCPLSTESKPILCPGAESPNSGRRSSREQKRTDTNEPSTPFPVQSRRNFHYPQGACAFDPIQPMTFVSTPISEP